MQLQLIILGAPGSGKGTQAKQIANTYKVKHISTGDLLRNTTDPAIKQVVASGGFISDEIVIQMVKTAFETAPKEGWILDGFPRTLPQAEALGSLLKTPPTVLLLKVPTIEIQNRLSLRRMCPKCHTTYHLEDAKPQKEGFCDGCQELLIIREDDKPEVVANRLKIYEEKTAPLIDYYDKKGLLIEIDGGSKKSPSSIFSEIKTILSRL